MNNWDNVRLVPEFNEQGVACYRLDGGDYVNEYYITSEAETRKLLNTPEVVGYEVYNCLIPSTCQMLYYLKEQKKVTTANILSILRGALNYPLEEACYKEHIRVHDISFLSSERVFAEDEMTGLEIKYSKLTMVPDSTLMIGDIIASGETLIHCLRYVTDFYRERGTKLRNIIIFTIGGTRGIDILENLTKEIREFWPEFEGFITVFYEGIFSTYQDKGVSGINLPDVDFYWKGGIVAPEFRRETLSMCSPLFEKCIIYDGGARLRNIIIFTIGGTKGIDILEKLTAEIRQFWPEFEGFITVYYEGIFSTYQDKGVSGINLPDVDFYWKGGIVAPEFRRETLSMCSPLFEKCIIYDGGARRYEIHEHVEEVLEFWKGISERADKIDFKELLDEKLGYPTPISYEDWVKANHYQDIRPADAKWLYRQELGYIESMKDITLKELAEQRIGEFTDALRKYILD